MNSTASKRALAAPPADVRKACGLRARSSLCNKGRSSCFLSKFLGHINPAGMKCLFYRYSYAYAYSSVGAQCISRLCFAPTELGLFCDRCSYKHSAPTELTRLVAAPPRCVLFGCFEAKPRSSRKTYVTVSVRQSLTAPRAAKPRTAMVTIFDSLVPSHTATVFYPVANAGTSCHAESGRR